MYVISVQEVPRSPGSSIISSSHSHGVYPGYNNPAYSQRNGGSLTSQPGSLIDLRLTKLQRDPSTLGSRLKWDDEDTDEYEVDSVLDGFVTDSGLHSLTVSIVN